MQIIVQGHSTSVSPQVHQRAEAGLRKLGTRIGNVVDATIRFAEDGPVKRVELELHAAGGRRFVAEAKAKYLGPAVSVALARLRAQIGHVKRTPKAKARWLARAS
jgi:ribosome-associated translation inhibitor RaiA